MSDSATAGTAQLPLQIPRGATWRPRIIPLIDRDTGQALRAVPAAGLTVAAQIRPRAGSPTLLHTFAVTIVEVVLPDTYGPDPVIAAQLDAIPATTTAAWTWETGRWDLLVDHEPVLAGPVYAPLVVTR